MVHWLYKGNNACFKRKLEEKKKTAWKKKIHSTMFYVLHNKEFKKKSAALLFLPAGCRAG